VKRARTAAMSLLRRTISPDRRRPGIITVQAVGRVSSGRKSANQSPITGYPQPQALFNFRQLFANGE